MRRLQKPGSAHFSLSDPYVFLCINTNLINLWTMSIRMNGPHAKTALIYTFILMPVKAQKIYSSKIIFYLSIETLLSKWDFFQIFVTEIVKVLLLKVPFPN